MDILAPFIKETVTLDAFDDEIRDELKRNGDYIAFFLVNSDKEEFGSTVIKDKNYRCNYSALAVYTSDNIFGIGGDYAVYLINDSRQGSATEFTWTFNDFDSVIDLVNMILSYGDTKTGITLGDIEKCEFDYGFYDGDYIQLENIED